MSALPRCIYCESSALPPDNREHVIPQSFGMFEDNWTLDCVCDDCNQYFGNKLELILGRDSNESLLRLRYGLKPPKEAGDLLNRRVTLMIDVDGPWKGARAFVSPTLDGASTEVLPFPQAGFRRPLEPDVTWFGENDLSEAMIAPYLPRGTEYRVVGPSRSDILRVGERLTGLGFPFREDSYAEQRLGDVNNQVTFAVEATLDGIINRAIAKIAFNYAARVLGSEFVRSPTFDPTRRFIRFNEAPSYQVTTPRFEPILADDAPLRRQTNGHLLLVEWHRSKSHLQARVSLFNEMTYVVRLCGRYSGLWVDVATGHLFDPFCHQIIKLTNLRWIRPVVLRPF